VQGFVDRTLVARQATRIWANGESIGACRSSKVQVLGRLAYKRVLPTTEIHTYLVRARAFTVSRVPFSLPATISNFVVKTKCQCGVESEQSGVVFQTASKLLQPTCAAVATGCGQSKTLCLRQHTTGMCKVALCWGKSDSVQLKPETNPGSVGGRVRRHRKTLPLHM